MTCRVPGCCMPAQGYSRYCNTHKSRERRHGHPEQGAITKAILRPHLKVVAGWRARNPEKAAWGKMIGQWLDLIDQCKADLAAYRRQGASCRPSRVARQELLKIADESQPQEVVDTVLAMFLLRDQQPGLFRSDQGFVYQLVRMVRGLAAGNCGVWIDPATGKPKRAYLDTPPRVTEVTGQLIVAALGSAGVFMAKLERQKEMQQRQRAFELAQAMGELR